MKFASMSTPELRGAYGHAWCHDLAAIEERERSNMPLELTVASWVVRAPYAHPLWSFYCIACVSLRDVEGASPAHVLLPGATHEVMVYALHPAVPPALDAHPVLLQPANFHGQFIAPSDAAAAARVRAVVQDVVDGKLNPDSDHVQDWILRFSNSNVPPTYAWQ